MDKKYVAFANGGAAFLGTRQQCEEWASKTFANQSPTKMTEITFAEVVGTFSRAVNPVIFTPIPLTLHSDEKASDVA
jgi:hypothetical protein